jgi:hypothetical protein
MDNSFENVGFQGCRRFILSCFQLDEAKGIKESRFFFGRGLFCRAEILGSAHFGFGNAAEVLDLKGCRTYQSARQLMRSET